MTRSSRPEWAIFGEMLSELRRSMDQLPETQKQLTKLTGTAWSPDRMVKAVVGPRGQLVELELDPRIYRRPNSTALAATIVATVQEAVADVMRRSNEIIDDIVPGGVRVEDVMNPEMVKMVRRPDIEMLADKEDEDG